MLVGPYLLEAAPAELDKSEATDLLILRARDMRIGCRIRRHEYLKDYGWDFTIRAYVTSGAKTELQKITEGWGDWLFYGFAMHDDVPSLSRWFLVDLHNLRAHLIRNGRRVKPRKLPNTDGSGFVAFDLRTFPPKPPILVAGSHDIPGPHTPRQDDLFAA